MFQRQTPRLILASASVSRRALLSAAGLDFTVRAAEVDERAVKRQARVERLDAARVALRLAELKAEAVARLQSEALVIGADQILVCDGEWFDKPADLAQARRQLLALRGRRHELATAVVCQQGTRRLWHHVAIPSLAMRMFSEGFLDAYLAVEATVITATVGAYQLERCGVHLFATVDGDYSAIVGLPLLPLLGFLREQGVLLA